MIKSLKMLHFLNIIKVAFNIIFCTIHLLVYKSHWGFRVYTVPLGLFTKKSQIERLFLSIHPSNIIVQLVLFHSSLYSFKKYIYFVHSDVRRQRREAMSGDATIGRDVRLRDCSNVRLGDGHQWRREDVQ